MAALWNGFQSMRDTDIYSRIMHTKRPRARFQLAWWFIISQSDRKADFIDHLIALGFMIPQWVDWSMPENRGPFPVQWGLLPVTLAAVSVLFRCFNHFYRHRELMVAQLVIDERNFLLAVNQAKVNLFDRRPIAQAIIYAVEKWEGDPVFSKNFKKGLKDDAFKKVGLSHYRIDNIPSNQFSSAKGCIAPSIFRSVYTSKKKVLEKQVLNQARYHARNNYGNYGNQANQPRYNQRNNYGNRQRYGNYNNNQDYGRKAANNYNANKGSAAQKKIKIVPNPRAESLKTAYGTHSPSTVEYPQEVAPPVSHKPLPIYAPKLGYFSCHFIYPEPPADRRITDVDAMRSLGKVPYLYCADFQSNNCTHPACSYHHLCEWCGASHHGNGCPFRPAFKNRSTSKKQSN